MRRPEHGFGPRIDMDQGVAVVRDPDSSHGCDEMRRRGRPDVETLRAAGPWIDSRAVGRLPAEADPQRAAVEEQTRRIRAYGDATHDPKRRGIDLDEPAVVPHGRPDTTCGGDHVERRITDAHDAHPVAPGIDSGDRSPGVVRHPERTESGR